MEKIKCTTNTSNTKNMGRETQGEICCFENLPEFEVHYIDDVEVELIDDPELSLAK